MKLSTILRKARSGELKSLSTKDKTDVVVIDFINTGLTALYSKFQLKTEEAIVTLSSGKTLYKLDGTDSDVNVSGLPIEADTVLQIIEASDEVRTIGINDDDDEMGIFTPSYDSIQVPVATNGTYISLIYKTNPVLVEFIDVGDGTAEEAEIPLPAALEIQLLHYVGYRAHGSVNGEIGAENNTHLMRFESSCKEAARLGIVPTDTYSRDVTRKGFV